MAPFAKFELKVFSAASLTGSYQDFGLPLEDPAYEVVLSNESDVGCIITTNTADDIRLTPGQILPLRGAYPRGDNTDGYFILRKGTQLQIKQATAAGTGSIIANVLTVG
jgi:hypothetical protein